MRYRVTPFVLNTGTVLLLIGLGALLLVSRRDAAFVPSATTVDGQVRTGTDTLLVFFVSSICGACREEPAASWFRGTLRSYAAQTPRFRTVGVALDLDPWTAIRYLDSLQHFDEISAGGSWTNHLALHYLFSDSVPVAAVPQLLLVERGTVVSRDTGRINVAVNDHVLDRFVGLHSISQWLQDASGGAR
jgi:hypothetical protein